MRPIAWTAEQTARTADAGVLHAERTAAPYSATRLSPFAKPATCQTLANPQRVLPCSIVQRGRLRLGLLEDVTAPTLSELQLRLRRYGSFRIKPTAIDIDPRELLHELGRGQLLVPVDPAHPEHHRAVHGRLPLLTDAAGARLAVTLGRASWRAHDDEQFEELRRLAFWSLEMGLIQERGAWRALGATVAAEPELALPDRGEPQLFAPELVVATRPTLRHDGALRFELGNLHATNHSVCSWARQRGLID